MSRHFKPRPGGGAAAAFDEFEAGLLLSYAAQMLELIDAREATADGDAEALIASAFHDGPTELPADPALARLFPDAYTDPDPGDPSDIDAVAASAEFRRFTEHDLRSRKRDDAQALIDSLEALAPEGRRRATLHLRPDECRHWLGALNDLRLVIASRLDITVDEDFDELIELPDTDPRSPLVMTYGWLTTLQDTLIEAMMR